MSASHPLQVNADKDRLCLTSENLRKLSEETKTSSDRIDDHGRKKIGPVGPSCDAKQPAPIPFGDTDERTREQSADNLVMEKWLASREDALAVWLGGYVSSATKEQGENGTTA